MKRLAMLDTEVASIGGVELGEGSGTRELAFIETDKAFDPAKVYGDTPNPTQL